jgi:hypothetical protein
MAKVQPNSDYTNVGAIARYRAFTIDRTPGGHIVAGRHRFGIHNWQHAVAHRRWGSEAVQHFRCDLTPLTRL